MNDPLFFNKLAAAVLSALLLFFGLPQLAGALLGGGGHHGGHGGELHLAYPIEFQTDAPAAEEEVEEVSFAELLAGSLASAGERRVSLCKSCHSFEKGGANGTGPALWDVIGRPITSVDGFNYSSALKTAGGEWTFERLDAYLKNSQEYIAGTVMNQRVAKPEHRAQILAYLRTLSDNPVPVPEPTPMEAVADGE
ncbi:MAG: c-type cytochrome [Pseudomonadota bacterium]